MSLSSYTVSIFLFFPVVRPIVELLGPSKPLQEGDSANLTCKIIEGFPEPRLSFFKNGELLSKEMTSPLLLTNVTDSDEGRYICEAHNGGGNFTDSRYIRVKSKLIIIIMDKVTIKGTIDTVCSFILLMPKN